MKYSEEQAIVAPQVADRGTSTKLGEALQWLGLSNAKEICSLAPGTSCPETLESSSRR